MDDDLQDAAYRLVEEKLYERVALEIAENSIKPGLWAKAMQLASGNKEKTEAEYIRLRVQNLLDEGLVEEEIQDSPYDDATDFERNRGF